MPTTEIIRDVSTSLDVTKSLFASLNVFHDIPSRSAALNMAIDEALLETAQTPSIRFYRWSHPALSFGYFGKVADVTNHAPERDLVRRWTGGGIVFHGEDLTYSVVIPAADPAFSESAISIYEKIHGALAKALIANGKTAVVVRRDALLRVRDMQKHVPPISRESECFANPVRADVLSNGRKIAGAAQRRTRRGLLQQGSIQDVDLTNRFADQFARELCSKSYDKMLDERLIARAHEIAGQKYETQAWLRKR
jgi:lipoyl(octanoyl) transferase